MSLLSTVIYKKQHFPFFVVFTSYTNCSNCSNCSWFIILLKTVNRSNGEVQYTSKCTLFSMLKYIKTTIMLPKYLNVLIQNSCFSMLLHTVLEWQEKWNNLWVYLPKITKRWQHSIQPKFDLTYNLYKYSTAGSTSRKCKWNRAVSCRVSQDMHRFISHSPCLPWGTDKHGSDGKFSTKWGERGGWLQLPVFLVHCPSVAATSAEVQSLFPCIWNH